MVLIALDARIEGVVVPPHLYHDPQLRLNISYRFGLPMTLDLTGIKATLTFSGTSFQCEIPWSAIFLAVSHVSGEPYLFAEDIPALKMADANPTSPPSGAEPVKSPPKLTLVRSPSDDAAEPLAESDQQRPMHQSPPQPVGNQQSANAMDSEPNPPNSPPSRGHLRLVK